MHLRVSRARSQGLTPTPSNDMREDTNYPAESRVVAAADIPRMGIRAVFFSNSCSAVVASTFHALGGFPTWLIMNEDMLFAHALLQSDHSIAYAADSVVQHSHAYSLRETFKRYFDIGVVLQQARAELGGLARTGSGFSYVTGLLVNLLRHGQFAWVPAAMAESLIKLIAVAVGQRHSRLPSRWLAALSMHPGHWTRA